MSSNNITDKAADDIAAAISQQYAIYKNLTLVIIIFKSKGAL